MNRKLIGGLGLLFIIAACTDNSTPPGEEGTPGGSGGSSAGTAGSPGSGGSAGVAGGSSGAPAAGSGGSAGSGISGAGSGTGGNAGAGISGGAGAGSGGSSTAGSGGTGGDGGGGTPAAGQGGTAGLGGGAAGTAGSGATGGVSTDVTVQLGQEKQEMAGFGINNNWSPAMTEAEADAMFDPEKGLGLSILRIGMASSGEPFNGANCWSDIEKAKARGVTTFIGTLWTPPANCKTNNSENNGGHLLENCYDSWSSTIAAFPAKVKQNTGVDLYAMSPQNEVDFASCGTSEPCNGVYPTTLFTADEYVALAKKVGPKLRALNPPVKLIGPEASEWLHVWSNESACCSEPGGKPSSDPLKGMGYDYGHALYADKEAWDLLDILGVHQYDTQVAEPWPSDVPDRKPVWQTEMSGVKWWPEQGPSTDINNAVAVAGWIHNALTVGEVSAWLWWWWKAQGDTNEGLLLRNGTDTKRRYSLGNYSRFVRPGYKRVEITGEIPEDVLLTAFKGPDGTVVVVAINKGTAAASVPIFVAGGTAPASVTPWVTSESDNLASKPAVSISGGSFTAELAGKTVTTFVGK